MKLWSLPPNQENRTVDELDLLIKHSFNNDEFLDDSFNAGVWGAVDRLKYGLRPVETCGFLARLRQKRKRLVMTAAIFALVVGFTLFRQPVVTALSNAVQKVEIIFQSTSGLEKFSVATRFLEKNIHGPDAEYGSDEYDKFLADVKKLPIKPVLLPKYIPEGYKYSKAHYYFNDNSSVLEGDQLFAAERYGLVIIYRSAKSLISIRQDSNIKKESMLKIPEKDLLALKDTPQILLDDGYKMTKVLMGQTEAVKAIKESQETVDIQLILPIKNGDVAIWYNAKTGDYDALSDAAKQKVEQDMIKIAESMMKKEIYK